MQFWEQVSYSVFKGDKNPHKCELGLVTDLFKIKGIQRVTLDVGKVEIQKFDHVSFDEIESRIQEAITANINADGSLVTHYSVIGV